MNAHQFSELKEIPWPFGNLWTAFKRGKLAHACAEKIYKHVSVEMRKWVAYTAETGLEPSDEVKRKINFWIRSANRYHRVSIGQSPWRKRDFTRD